MKKVSNKCKHNGTEGTKQGKADISSDEDRLKRGA